MTTPVILLPADVREIDRYRWHMVVDTYLKALLGIGALPLILPSLGQSLDLDAALDRADGVLATGSRSNVHPTRYGAAPTARHEPFDEARDATTLPLIRRCLDRGIPLLAICRGMQELNVALGGDLIAEIQDEPGRMDHRSPNADDNDVRFRLAHDVTFEDDSRLAAALGGSTIRVNSLHRQALGRLAPRLEVEARAPDGTVEAVRVEGARAFAYGVQWHPEYWASTDAPSAALFRAFGEAARRRLAARSAKALRDAAE